MRPRSEKVNERRRDGVDLGERPILGEKGVGRVSAMRLGSLLRVETARLTDASSSLLDIDWSLFSRHPDRRLEEIDIVPRPGPAKSRPKGTVLSIRQLSTNWSVLKLEDIAKTQFSRLNDPLEAAARFPFDLTFNGATVPVPAFRRLLLEYAHAVLTASFGLRRSALKGPFPVPLANRVGSFLDKLLAIAGEGDADSSDHIPLRLTILPVEDALEAAEAA